MYHILRLFLLHNIPALFRQLVQRGPKHCMVLFPSHALEPWVRIWERSELKFGFLKCSKLCQRCSRMNSRCPHPGKIVLGQYLCCFLLLLRVPLPLNVAMPALPLFRKECFGVALFPQWDVRDFVAHHCVELMFNATTNGPRSGDWITQRGPPSAMPQLDLSIDSDDMVGSLRASGS